MAATQEAIEAISMLCDELAISDDVEEKVDHAVFAFQIVSSICEVVKDL